MTSSYTVCMDAVEKARNSPGVGAYDISKSYAKGSKGFTFGIGYKKEKMFSTAGPGSYNIESKFSSSGFTFPRESRKSVARSNTPDCVGPNTYYVKSNGPNMPAYTMGQKSKNSPFNNYPGVGSYNIDKRISEKSIGTMGGRY